MIELIFTKGPRAGERFAVEAESVSIGRLADCDIELNQSNVSRKHAVLKRQGDQLSIVDNRSGNGTFVNGKRVSQAKLRAGDVVRIGDHTIRIAVRTDSLPKTVREMLAEQPTRRELISRFLIEDRSGSPRHLEFAGDNLSLGRGEKCKLVLDDEEISRLHATINYREDKFELRDVGSANGTYLNGEPIIEAEIRDGDKLEMGHLVILAHILNNHSLHLDIAKKTTESAAQTSASGAQSSEHSPPSSAKPVSPVTVKKLKDSRPVPHSISPAARPSAKPRTRYTIITGLAFALVVALLLAFAGRTYAAPPRARIDAAPSAVYSTGVPSMRLLLSGAQTPMQD